MWSGGAIVDWCPIDTVEFTSDRQQICAGQRVHFFDRTRKLPTAWRWSFPGAVPDYSFEKDPAEIRYPVPGQYPVSLWVSNPVSEDSTEIVGYITVLPAAEVQGDTFLTKKARLGDTLQLEACATGLTYFWSPATGLSCTDCPSPTCIPMANTDYSCIVRGDSICDLLCRVVVELSDEERIYAPTVFSPNGDGVNDVFEIFGAQFEPVRLQIFSRWGEQLYTSEPTVFQWDGMFRGRPLGPGVYVWKIDYIDLRHNKRKIKWGDVTIAR